MVWSSFGGQPETTKEHFGVQFYMTFRLNEFSRNSRIMQVWNSIFSAPMVFAMFLKLFQLPFSQIVFGAENCNQIKKQIVQHNWVFINKEKIEWINEKLNIPFLENYSVESTLKQCLKFIEKSKLHYVEDKNDSFIELEYLFQYAKLFNQMITLTTKYPYLENSKGFYSLYKQILSSANASNIN